MFYDTSGPESLYPLVRWTGMVRLWKTEVNSTKSSLTETQDIKRDGYDDTEGSLTKVQPVSA